MGIQGRGDDIVALWDTEGLDGWEIVSVIKSRPAFWTVVFKRQRVE
jgi:hypothetical protein